MRVQLNYHFGGTRFKIISRFYPRLKAILNQGGPVGIGVYANRYRCSCTCTDIGVYANRVCIYAGVCLQTCVCARTYIYIYMYLLRMCSMLCVCCVCAKHELMRPLLKRHVYGGIATIVRAFAAGLG